MLQQVFALISRQSFETVDTAVNDSVLVAKLQFFLSVSKQIQPFLTKF